MGKSVIGLSLQRIGPFVDCNGFEFGKLGPFVMGKSLIGLTTGNMVTIWQAWAFCSKKLGQYTSLTCQSGYLLQMAEMDKGPFILLLYFCVLVLV
jgi:hypothetical protein